MDILDRGDLIGYLVVQIEEGAPPFKLIYP